MSQRKMYKFKVTHKLWVCGNKKDIIFSFKIHKNRKFNHKRLGTKWIWKMVDYSGVMQGKFTNSNVINKVTCFKS